MWGSLSTLPRAPWPTKTQKILNKIYLRVFDSRVRRAVFKNVPYASCQKKKKIYNKNYLRVFDSRLQCTLQAQICIYT